GECRSPEKFSSRALQGEGCSCYPRWRSQLRVLRVALLRALVRPPVLRPAALFSEPRVRLWPARAAPQVAPVALLLQQCAAYSLLQPVRVLLRPVHARLRLLLRAPRDELQPYRHTRRPCPSPYSCFL